MRKLTKKPWGKEEKITQEYLSYAGKLIHVKTGHQLSLQIHDEKTETMCLLSGHALLYMGDKWTPMELHKGYTIPAGMKHRLKAVTECLVMEVSTPETGETHRLEDDYGRGDE